jgi:hypothetical protein
VLPRPGPGACYPGAHGRVQGSSGRAPVREGPEHRQAAQDGRRPASPSVGDRMAGAGAQAGVRSLQGPLRADRAHTAQVAPAQGRGRGPTHGSAPARPVRRGRPGLRRTWWRARWASGRRRRPRWARWSRRRAWNRRTRRPCTRGSPNRRRPCTRGPPTPQFPDTRGPPTPQFPDTREPPARRYSALTRSAARDGPEVAQAEHPSANPLGSRTDPPWVRIDCRSVRHLRFPWGAAE